MKEVTENKNYERIIKFKQWWTNEFIEVKRDVVKEIGPWKELFNLEVFITFNNFNFKN